MTAYKSKDHPRVVSGLKVFEEQSAALVKMSEDLAGYDAKLDENFIVKIVVEELTDMILGPKTNNNSWNVDRLEFELSVQKRFMAIMEEVLAEAKVNHTRSKIVIP